MSDFDPYHKWLSIPKKDQPPHHYRLLGLELFEEDPDVIDAAANRVMTYLQQCATGKHAALSQKILNEVSQARVELLNKARKAKYDTKLRKKLAPAAPAAAPQPTVEFAEAPAEPDPLAFLNQGPREIDFDEIEASATKPQRKAATPSNGIPSWAIVGGVAVVVVLGLVVVGKMFSKGSSQPTPEVATSTTDPSDDDASMNRKRPSSSNDKNKKPVDAASVAAATGSKPNSTAPSPSNSSSTLRELSNRFGMTFVLIPKGEFMMGSSVEANTSYDERPRHRVVLSRPFYLSKYETTLEQYNAVTGYSRPGGSQTPKFPVADIDWFGAREFCRKLTIAESMHCRLPTEAEWEYACRAGTTTRWSFGELESSLHDHAYFELNSDRRIQDVGRKKPNAWGLYDMHGNVGEWCWDAYANNFYERSRLEDPIGFEPSNNSTRIYRGGTFDSSPSSTTSAYRAAQSPQATSPRIGFRIVIEADQFGEPLKYSETSPFSLLQPQSANDSSTNMAAPSTPTTSTTTSPTASTSNSTTTKAKAPPRPSHVPAEAIYWKSNWYWFPTDVVPFKEALRLATARKGRLVSISSEAENNFVTENIHGPTLIGCAKVNGRWFNSVGQPQRYFNWDVTQPSGTKGETYVGTFQHGRWHDYAADRLRYVIEWGDED